MCTLVVVLGVWPELPLLVAANRDERRGRPVWAPAEYSVSSTRVFGPRDAEAGGTWLGVNEHGLFAGITNRFGAAPVPGRRSRGLLVTDALAEHGVAAAAGKSRAHEPSAHNGFHLVIADRTRAALVFNDGASVHHETLEPGVHVLTERSLGAADALREQRVREAFGRLAQARRPPTQEAIISIMAVPSSALAPFDGTVMDVPEYDYGTRSSTILRFEPDRLRFWHAEGPPTTTPYRAYAPFSKS